MGELKHLIKKFTESFGEAFPKETYTILYAPERCFLGLVDKDGNVEVRDNADKLNLDKVYEARIFNDKAELRWLKSGETNTLTDTDLRKEENFVDTIDQKYLLWGKKNSDSSNGWTQFAEARIGAFYVPVTLTNKEYAVFEAIEYLKEFDDGNVAVFEERLTGISEVD